MTDYTAKITNPDRDFNAEPLTTMEAIVCFKEEMFELALASEDVIDEAAASAEAAGDDATASGIHSRYDDYQEELRIMAAEFA